MYVYTYTCMYVHKAIQLSQFRFIQIHITSNSGFAVAHGITVLKIHKKKKMESEFTEIMEFTVALV